MKRRTAREKSFQILFQMDVNDIPPKEAIEHVMDGPADDAFLTDLVYGVIEHKQEIDEKIDENLENWTFNRLASVERTLLRIAAYELSYKEDVPSSVAINEAIELANSYGDEKSGRFINGVLSKMLK
ncbi:transcription antitermination factor NusB [Sediminibacillus dalangtanensis]|uniref:Transcription antitermination protein NusB n=1 Tax=Sediminibacillus dalangtanensis TaxID=2729421 RepID=A0ABX7VS75_9BACI|nr:transcription antitermination factor NusB [Sediminibacillus dalangtanensis]QTM99787.1 transcription antitermination factor NusB [Sediminibacillus dalangtanensis]